MPVEIPSAEEKISPEKSPQVVANNFKEVEEFEDGVKSKTTAGLQMTDVDNLNNSLKRCHFCPLKS